MGEVDVLDGRFDFYTLLGEDVFVFSTFRNLSGILKAFLEICRFLGFLGHFTP